MSTFFDAARVQQYARNVEMLLQQEGSRLERAVGTGSYTGKAASVVEQIGAVTAQKRTGRHSDTPLISTPHDKRWVHPFDYEWADLIDDQDKLRTLVEFSSPYAQNGAMALGRAKDIEIVQAFFASAKTGENGSTDTAFPSGQSVSVSTGGTTSNINVAKLQEAKKLLIAASNNMDETCYCALTAAAHDALLKEIQIVSRDYNSAPVLENGFVKRFMGFEFIVLGQLPDGSEMLQTGTDDAAGTSRAIPVWCKSGMHLGQWGGITTKITERADKSHSTQVYVKGTFGATRTQEKKVVRIWARNG